MAETKVIDVKDVKIETDKAWLAILKDGNEVWFPKSQCNMQMNKTQLVVPEWLLKAKSLN